MPVKPFDLNTALKLGHFVQDAYGLFDAADLDNFQLKTAGYQIVHKLYANDLYDDIPDYVIFWVYRQHAERPL